MELALSGEASMQYIIASTVFQFLLAGASFFVAWMLLYLYVKRPSAFDHPPAIFPVAAWLITKGIVHFLRIVETGARALEISNNLGLILLLAIAINAVAAVIASFYLFEIFNQMFCTATPRENRLAADAVSKTLADTVAGNEIALRAAEKVSVEKSIDQSGGIPVTKNKDAQ